MPGHFDDAMRRLTVATLLQAPVLTACTGFGTLRSAQVAPGPSFQIQASVTSPPGDDAAWFWSLCADHCDHAIAAPDINLGYGFVSATGPTGAVSLGISGTFPYVDGYLQLGKRERAAEGLGVRVGLPLGGWNEHMVYGRIDRPLGRHQRLLLNPGIFYHGGNSPNGENPGTFLGLSQGFGLLFEGTHASFAPGVTLIVARVDRSSYGQTVASDWTGFAVFSASVMFHRRPLP